jgi:hypothetical protein
VVDDADDLAGHSVPGQLSTCRAMRSPLDGAGARP